MARSGHGYVQATCGKNRPRLRAGYIWTDQAMATCRLHVVRSGHSYVQSAEHAISPLTDSLLLVTASPCSL
jgi:hypothetical protein